ncbi:MAG: hypothetical protein CVV24_10090 [Ignavibacteriae bacterium HGW-Ignavibacteriae-3]|nr:MAG: hypothetical protein CVV24_10090 [Ignavibacteriae bacterium HGW-Ignavibacteriae-3]
MRRLIILSLVVLSIFSSCKLKDTSSSTVTEPTGTSTAITVVTPNGGEQLAEGSSYQIQWTGTGTSHVKIQYSIDNGSTWSLLVDSLKNTGVYSWFPVPNTISNQCRIRIASITGVSSATSKNIFAIIRNSNESLSLVSPVGKESWEAGTAKQIKWYSSGLDSVKLEYTTNNGQQWKLIAVDKKNTGIYFWEPVPNTPSTLAKIRISDAKDGSPSVESPGVFEILPEPKLRVISPNGGEKIIAGSNRKIEYISENIENVKIAYSSNNGFSWNTITSSTPSIGFYNWNPVPNINSQLCKIRIYDALDGEPSDVSDSVFTITNQVTQTIEVKIPNGGEKWQAGTAQNITWISSGITAVKLEFTSNNGITWNTIVNNYSNTGSYEWNVPNSLSSQCIIKISDAADGDPADQSNATFSIVPKPELRVLKPNGGETWTGGFADTLKWYSLGVENVTIEYSPNNGGTWVTLVEKTPSSGSYITSFSAAGTQYKIRIKEYTTGSPVDESDGTFTVTPEPKITVLVPNGNEEWYAGSSDNIKWSSANISNVKIEYTINNGASWTTIVASTPSTGAYSWNPIPNVSSLQCRIRISDAVKGIPSDMSDNNFSITNQGLQLVKVKTPNGGELWPAGTSQTITWDAAGISNVKIEYTSNNGISWSTIVSSTPSTGFYTWSPISATPSTNCKVRISDAADGSPSSTSDAFFTIGPPGTIKIVTPNGNDTWITGTASDIKWTSENVVNVKIEYTTNAGGSWNTIVNSTPSIGSYTWQNIPDANNSLQCRIRVSEAQYGAPSAISADNFAIMRPGAQQLRIVTPNGGEKWNVGSQQNIIWDAGGIANVKIEYTTNNGLNWTVLTASTPSNGYYTWNPIPNTPATNCKVRLSDAADGDPAVVSANTFSILPAPSIRVVAPNGGETIQFGAPTEIQWISENIENVKIEYTTNGGAGWNLIINSVESLGSYVWNTVPNTNSLQCKVRISDASNGSSSDISDNNFAITNVVQKSIKVISPNGGEKWEAGTAQNITWNASNVQKVKVDLTTDKGSNWTNIVDNYSGGAYEWSVSSALNSTQCQIRVTDYTDNSISDVSDATFTIAPKKFITVTGPLTAIYKSDQPITITWNSGGIEKVGIKYTTTNGVADPSNPAFTELATVGASAGSFTTYFAKPSDKYFVVVYNADEGSNGLPSNNSPGFTVEAAVIPTVNILYPKGGEQWLSTKLGVPNTDLQNYHPFEIKWNAANTNKVKIEWTTNGGGKWYVVPRAASTENDGSLVWAPGNELCDPSDGIGPQARPDSSDNCKLRISSADAGVAQISNTSGYFSIHGSKKIKVEFPNNGEDFYPPTSAPPVADIHWPMAIRWTSYAVTSVNIYYSLDNGVTWTTLATNYQSTGAYAWDFITAQPETRVSTLGRIKIEDAALEVPALPPGQRMWDVNDVPFWLNIKKVSGNNVPETRPVNQKTVK